MDRLQEVGEDTGVQEGVSCMGEGCRCARGQV